MAMTDGCAYETRNSLAENRRNLSSHSETADGSVVMLQNYQWFRMPHEKPLDGFCCQLPNLLDATELKIVRQTEHGTFSVFLNLKSFSRSIGNLLGSVKLLFFTVYLSLYS